MNYNDLLSFRAEYALSAKICDKCTDMIDEGCLCLSKSVNANSFDVTNSPWFHLDCFFAPSKSKSRQRPDRTGQIGFFGLLRTEDQDKIREKIDAENRNSGTTRRVIVNGKKYLDDEEQEIVPISKLEMPVQDLLTEIFQPQLQILALAQYQQRNLPKPDFMLNLEKMPWGRLKHEQIIEACKVLKEVLEMLDDSNRNFKPLNKEEELDELTLRFLELITQNFGSDFPCPLVNNRDPLFKVKLRVLKFFLDSVLGYLLLVEIDQTKNRQHSPAQLDSDYINLQCHVTTLDQKSEMGLIINKFFKSTITTASNAYFPGLPTNIVLEIGHIFSVERYDEEKRSETYRTNRKLLWHASPVANFVGILSTGLRMTQARGGRFGPGIYFADAVNKSIGYARPTAADKCVLLLLCEVALGHEHPPAEKTICSPENSIKFVGSCFPDPSEHVVLPTDVLVPMGKLINRSGHDGVLHSGFTYNEYIVYNEAQVRLRYLVQIKLKR